MLMDRPLYLVGVIVAFGILFLQLDKHPETDPSAIFGPIQARFDERASLLHKTIQRDEHGNQIMFRIREVNDLLQQMKNETLKAIPEDNIPLRQYVERRFPRPLAPDPSGFALEADVGDVVEETSGVLKKLGALSAFRFNLNVSSKPPEARFELIPPIGVPVITTTNDTITNIYRGEYDYEIKKVGYEFQVIAA